MYIQKFNLLNNQRLLQDRRHLLTILKILLKLKVSSIFMSCPSVNLQIFFSFATQLKYINKTNISSVTEKKITIPIPMF